MYMACLGSVSTFVIIQSWDLANILKAIRYPLAVVTKACITLYENVVTMVADAPCQTPWRE